MEICDVHHENTCFIYAGYFQSFFHSDENTITEKTDIILIFIYSCIRFFIIILAYRHFGELGNFEWLFLSEKLL